MIGLFLGKRARVVVNCDHRLLYKRIAELEAELAQEQENHRICAERAHHQWARSEKAESRWDSCKRMLEDRNAQLDKAEAEVERLRTFLMDEFVLDGLSTEDAAKAVHVLLKERDDG